MSMVRFATLCVRCSARSEEYTSWPECRDCQEHICPKCDIESERTGDEWNLTLCVECRALQPRPVTIPKLTFVDISLFGNKDHSYLGCWKVVPKKSWELQRHADGRWSFYSDGNYVSLVDGHIEGTLRRLP